MQNLQSTFNSTGQLSACHLFWFSDLQPRKALLSPFVTIKEWLFKKGLGSGPKAVPFLVMLKEVTGLPPLEVHFKSIIWPCLTTANFPSKGLLSTLRLIEGASGVPNNIKNIILLFKIPSKIQFECKIPGCSKVDLSISKLKETSKVQIFWESYKNLSRLPLIIWRY